MLTNYVINEGYNDERREISADRFAEEGSFIIFYDSDGSQVLALPKDRVFSIEVKKA